MSENHRFESIGVIDDDADDAGILKFHIEEVGRKAFVFSEGFKDLNDLRYQVKAARIDAAICDHRLWARQYAPFAGAEAVARLIEWKIPAVLTSHYTNIDVQTGIRLWRRKIPVLLPKDSLAPDTLIIALKACESEMNGQIPPSRRAYRTLVRIDNVENDVVDAFVPAWNPDMAIRFPRSLFPQELGSKLKPEQRFFAKVNIGAENANELFFEDFELAPEISTGNDKF